MTRALLLMLFLARAASAQLVLHEVRDGVARPLGTFLDLGAVGTGDVKSTRLRIYNAGSAIASVTAFHANGAGFSLHGMRAPFSVAPGLFEDTELRFTASSAASYSANLQLNSATTIVVVRVTAAPELTVFPGCTAFSPRTIDFGSVTQGEQRLCNFNLQNTTQDPMTIHTLAVAGEGFSGPGRAAPFTLAAGQTISFTVEFTPARAGVASGSLTIQSRVYDLKATGLNPPFPKPTFDFGPQPLTSGQQRTLTLRLPQPAPFSVEGTLELALLRSVSLVTADPAVVFLSTATRSVRFTIAQGSTEALIEGGPSIPFQTGTTAGRLRFTLSGPAFAADPATVVTIPPAPMTLDSAVASRSGSALDVKVAAFDNTYTAGSMAFRFYDAQGNLFGGAAIPADFRDRFQAYFSSIPGGSAFQMSVRFPVSGDTSSITAVEVDLANSAGVARTQRLTFQ